MSTSEYKLFIKSLVCSDGKPYLCSTLYDVIIFQGKTLFIHKEFGEFGEFGVSEGKYSLI